MESGQSSSSVKSFQKPVAVFWNLGHPAYPVFPVRSTFATFCARHWVGSQYMHNLATMPFAIILNNDFYKVCKGHKRATGLLKHLCWVVAPHLPIHYQTFDFSVDPTKVAQIGSQKLHNITFCCFCKVFSQIHSSSWKCLKTKAPGFLCFNVTNLNIEVIGHFPQTVVITFWAQNCVALTFLFTIVLPFFIGVLS